MIDFQCPGCLNHHAANAAFAGLLARCIVCGVAIRIPDRSGVKAALAEEVSHTGGGSAFVARAAARGSRPPQPSRPAAAEDEDAWDDADNDESEFESVPTPRPAAPRNRPGTFPLAADPADEDIEIDLSSDHEADFEETDALDAEAKKPRPEPKAPPVDPATRRKNKIRMGIAGGAIAVIAVAGFLFSGGKSKPKPQQQVAQREDTVGKAPPPPPQAQPPKPPPKKDEPPKPVEPPKVLAVAPAPHFAGEPVPFAATTLVAERAAAAQVFDRNLESRRVTIQGAIARFDRTVLVLGDSPQDQANAIACELPKGALDDLKLQPGQAIVISGVYAPNLRVQNCQILRTTLPTDEEFKDRDVELTGIVLRVEPEGSVTFEPGGTPGARFPTLHLSPPTTDPLISVRCLFRLSERETVSTIKVGQSVTVRGRCEGRTFRVVRFHDCAIASASDPAPPGLVRVEAAKFFAAYETDLLPVPRPAPDAQPVVVGAEQLAELFETDPVQANATYRHKLTQVTGRVLPNSKQGNRVVLETGTGQRYQVELVFTPAQFALLRDETVLTARGCCAGVRGGVVRFENCRRFDPELGNAATRTTAGHFPLEAGRELIYDVLTPRGGRDNPITRYGVKFTEADVIRTTAQRTGYFPKATLFDVPDRPRWVTGGRLPAASSVQVRNEDGTIELRDKPAPPAQPAAWWDPVLKIGARKGETWSSTMPDGREVTYTVTAFGKDARGRNTVEITRVVKNPKDKKSDTWEETTLTYAHGVGEVRRVLTRQSAAGRGLTLLEMRLVEPDAELKTEPKGDQPDAKKDDK